MIKRFIIKKLLRLFFIHDSPSIITKEQMEEFESLFLNGVTNGTIEFKSSQPKHIFLQYLAQNKNVLFHGSNNPNIEEFEPKPQTLYSGKMMKAVFATKDPIWPFYYAVFRRNNYQGSLRNACLVMESGSNKKGTYYYFSVNQDQFKKENIWQKGTIYIFPRERFTRVAGKKLIYFDEWISEKSLLPITKIEVLPEDFPYLSEVVGHNEKENIIKSWLMYRYRRKKKAKTLHKNK